MLKNIQGIITRKIKYGETSLIVDLLTPEFGLRSFIIGGVRKKTKKNLSSIFQILNIVDAVVYDRNPDKLCRIKEISYGYVYNTIPFDIVKSSIATFIVEISRQSARVGDDSQSIYNFIVKALINLDQKKEDLANFHIYFLINLAEILGFKIYNNHHVTRPYFNFDNGNFHTTRTDHRHSLSEYNSSLLAQFLIQDKPVTILKEDRKAILFNMVDYYKYHIEGFGKIKSLDVLVSLFD